jgi:predicted dithiol-disulfide oxidoreductase (DUF899 family)
MLYRVNAEAIRPLHEWAGTFERLWRHQLQKVKERAEEKMKNSTPNDFNRDYHVSFTKEEKASGKVYYNYEEGPFPSEEGPGISVFYKDKAGNIFHTYSAYARGTETTMNTYNYLDYVPKGRDEDGFPFTMQWLRHHDGYEDRQLADKDRPYWPARAASAS